MDSTLSNGNRPESRQGQDIAMPKQTIVLQDLLSRLPMPRVRALIAEHNADKHVSVFTTKTMLLTLVHAQLAGIAGLREAADATATEAQRLRPLGIRPVAKSTLGDALNRRPAAVFQQVFAALTAQANRRLRRETGEFVRLIDSTSLLLNSHSAKWAKFSTSVCGAKAHIVYDPDADTPVYCTVTAARVSDVTEAQAMPIEEGATYVFDLGYYDYAWWRRMHDAKCRIVTRFKKNTPLTGVRWAKLYDPGLPLLSDRIGKLPARQAKNRKNPFDAEVREVTVRTDTGKILRILTNDLDSPAQEIADLYKRRWAIELLFRWLKQNLRLTKFMGTSENGIRIQVFAALIAFLLLRLAYEARGLTVRMIRFVRGVRRNLLERRPVEEIVASLAAPPRRTRKSEAVPAPRPRSLPRVSFFGNIFQGVGAIQN